MKATPFSLPDARGKIHSLSDYLGKWVVIYFYPKDDTPGCTKEACSFRDLNSEFEKRNVVVLGISKDSVKSHAKFADRYTLSFPILSDETQKVIKAYGAFGKKKFMGKEFEGTLRSTVLIDPKGMLVKRYDQVNPLNHTAEILRDLEALTK